MAKQALVVGAIFFSDFHAAAIVRANAPSVGPISKLMVDADGLGTVQIQPLPWDDDDTVALANQTGFLVQSIAADVSRGHAQAPGRPDAGAEGRTMCF